MFQGVPGGYFRVINKFPGLSVELFRVIGGFGGHGNFTGVPTTV